jgi:hypothetical protein
MRLVWRFSQQQQTSVSIWCLHWVYWRILWIYRIERSVKEIKAFVCEVKEWKEDVREKIRSLKFIKEEENSFVEHWQDKKWFAQKQTKHAGDRFSIDKFRLAVSYFGEWGRLNKNLEW